MEFWNLVFMQYERGEGAGKSGYPILGELPRRNIDTGMGLERMATLLQGVDNLYEIDETRPVLDRAAQTAGVRYGADHEADVRLRVVADHVRTALMLLADGTAPGNEGRGYVLRRILRRAVRSMRLLGHQDPSLPELLPVARDCMAPSYPEIVRLLRADRRSGVRGGGRLPLHSPAGHDVLDTAVARCAQREGTVARRAGVPAARHLRVPHGPDPGDGRGARCDRRPRGVHRTDGAAARAGPR